MGKEAALKKAKDNKEAKEQLKKKEEEDKAIQKLIQRGKGAPSERMSGDLVEGTDRCRGGTRCVQSLCQ